MRGATAAVLLITLVEPGCSSSGSGPVACAVTCPPGTRCEGDRCLPLCSPACAADEHCGVDRVCHKGPAPDGAVVPPVDAGAKYDKGGGPAPDAAQKLDAGNSALCTCLAQQPRSAYCFKQALSCSKPADCCMVSSVPCGTYSNKFACVAGTCVRAGCQSKAECVAYAQAIKQTDSGDWDCHQPLCPGMLAYCGRAIKSCAKPVDCCYSRQRQYALRRLHQPLGLHSGQSLRVPGLSGQGRVRDLRPAQRRPRSRQLEFAAPPRPASRPATAPRRSRAASSRRTAASRAARSPAACTATATAARPGSACWTAARASRTAPPTPPASRCRTPAPTTASSTSPLLHQDLFSLGFSRKGRLIELMCP